VTTSPPVQPEPSAPAHAVATNAPAAHHSASARPALVRRVAVTHRAAPQRRWFAFALDVPSALFRLPQAGAPSRGNGWLLLVSSVAMAVVAVASLSLLQRLRRLELG
jgi:hypothetical protein